MPPTPEQMARFPQRDEKAPFEWRNLRREGSGSDRTERFWLYYPIYLQNENICVPSMTWNEWVKSGYLMKHKNPEARCFFVLGHFGFYWMRKTGTNQKSNIIPYI
jgi:adenine-specific DNA-methyltransferase